MSEPSPRVKTRTVSIGGRLTLGGGAPIAVQSMWDAPIVAITDTLVEEIASLEKWGCNLMRFSVETDSQVLLLKALAARLPFPICADVHFNYRLAVACLDAGIPKVRINPGNIGARWKVEEIITRAADKNASLRIGVNGGSLPKVFRKESDRASAMVNAAEEQLKPFEKARFSSLVVSLKSSCPEETYQANKLFSAQHDYPLHLGVTEAGPLIPALVKSVLCLSRLLREGIGDTIRISISDRPEKEVRAGRELLSRMGLQTRSVNVISCPRCGRASFDTHTFASEVEVKLARCDKDITVAIMGCLVNGPEESRHADLGITGYGDQVMILKKGKIIRKAPASLAKDVFFEELGQL